MGRQLRCPNCGGEHTLVNPGITMLVCNYCKTTVYWGTDEVVRGGEKAILPESDTRLFLHATGKLKGQGFEVVGHLRYDHGRGSWDEWYLQLDNAGEAWISEDARQLSLEVAAQPDSALPLHAQLRAGTKLALGGVGYSVREVGQARCVGGEGQLPFTLLPGETYGYADLASLDGERFATMEFDEEGQPSCFAGETLDHEQLKIDDEPPPSTAKPTEGKHIKCASCAAPLEVPGNREVETKVCEYCGAQLDLTGTEQRVLGVNPKDLDPLFTFKIGDGGTFYGERYEVCGRMHYVDEEGYVTREYLLFGLDAGYLWLAEEHGHFVLNRPTRQAPARDPFSLTTRQATPIGKTPFRLYEQGRSRLTYVDGALPWLATVGDAFRYADLIAPPQIFSVESDGKEIEYFHGRYVSPDEVWKAFKREDTQFEAVGVHPAQPFTRGEGARMVMLVGGVFALINLLLAGWSTTRPGEVVFQQSYDPKSYLEETVSRPFTLAGGNVVGLTLGAPLSNSWLAIDAAFLDGNDQVVAEMDGAIEYYYGVEGGEGWSEGSRSKTAYFKAPAPGRYRLIVKASAGSGSGGPPRGEKLQLEVRAGTVLTRYFFAAFIFAVFFPLFEMIRRVLFEGRRWAPVTEDD